MGVSETVRLWLRYGDRGHFINDGRAGQGHWDRRDVPTFVGINVMQKNDV
jgi:hypothetical protein